MELDTKVLISDLESKGFKVNETKSCLVPTQEIIYLGLKLNSVLYEMLLSEERIRSICAVSRFFGKAALTSNWADGLDSFGHSTGTVSNESVSALDSGATFVSKTSPRPESNSDITLYARSPSMERSVLS